VDFTSAPKPGHPIVVVAGQRIRGATWAFSEPVCLTDWAGFEAFLRTDGPWLAGMDFPLGLPDAFCDRVGWPDVPTMQAAVRAMSREEWKEFVLAHPPRESRPDDVRLGGASPLNVVNPPVGLMFYEGARRLWDAGVSLPGIAEGDPQRRAVEVYPGAVAAKILPRDARQLKSRPYKGNPKGVTADERRQHREQILAALPEFARLIGLEVEWSEATRTLACADDAGDVLDGLIAAMVAAWAVDQRSVATADLRNSRQGGIIFPLI
jgi:hypothetical protein